MFVICHYWYFLDEDFKFQPDVCNDCQYVLMISMNHNDVAILNICGVNYCCIINESSKRKAENVLQNVDLSKKVKHYKILIYLKNM